MIPTLAGVILLIFFLFKAFGGDPAEILARRGDGVGLFINPVGIGEVMTLADQGERMPQKSTFFFPKLATGLVFHPLYP